VVDGERRTDVKMSRSVNARNTKSMSGESFVINFLWSPVRFLRGS
jgi:hypothetical protein